MPSPEMQILQTVLDRQSDAILAGDVRAYGQTMALPYRRTFANAEYVVETTAELISEVSTFSRSIKGLGVNYYFRLATSAERLGPDYISGTFVTHTLRNTTPIIDSFENRCVLKLQDDDVWSMIEFESNLLVDRFPVDMARAPLQSSPYPMMPEDDPRRMSLTPLGIYQSYLDQTARAVAEDDFAGYVDLMQFPYEAHGGSLDQVIAGPEDLRPFYNVIRKCHDGTVGDRIERVASKAEFVGSDTICGYHVGTVYLGDKQTVDPVSSCMILKRDGTCWRLKTVNNSIDNTTYPFSMFQPGGKLRTHLEIQRRTQH